MNVEEGADGISFRFIFSESESDQKKIRSASTKRFFTFWRRVTQFTERVLTVTSLHRILIKLAKA